MNDMAASPAEQFSSLFIARLSRTIRWRVSVRLARARARNAMGSQSVRSHLRHNAHMRTAAERAQFRPPRRIELRR